MSAKKQKFITLKLSNIYDIYTLSKDQGHHKTILHHKKEGKL